MLHLSVSAKERLASTFFGMQRRLLLDCALGIPLTAFCLQIVLQLMSIQKHRCRSSINKRNIKNNILNQFRYFLPTTLPNLSNVPHSVFFLLYFWPGRGSESWCSFPNFLFQKYHFLTGTVLLILLNYLNFLFLLAGYFADWYMSMILKNPDS